MNLMPNEFIRSLVAMLASLCLAASVYGDTAPLGESLTAEEREVLANEDVVFRAYDHGGGACKNSQELLLVIDAPKDVVWKILSDSEKFVEFVPNLVSITPYETDEADTAEQQVTSTWGVKTTYHVLRDLDEEKGVIAWRIDGAKENDIEDTHGRWLIEAYDGKTLASYGVCLDAGGTVRNTVVSLGGKGKAKEFVTALRTRAEEQASGE